jgi:molybdopterin-containing oxidoreductase family membrane subunit
MSGAAAAILFTHYAYKMRNEEMDTATFKGVQAAGKVLTLLLFLVGVATAWRFISFYVGGTEVGRIASDALISGPLATNFWIFEIAIGIIFPLALLAVTKLNSLPAMSLAALMTLVGQFFSRYDLVVAGQLVPQYNGIDMSPNYFSYIPSVSELLVTMAGIGLVGAAFILGERFFGRAFNDHGAH